VNTWANQIKIMIDQPQILYILKTGLQSTVEIVLEVVLMKFPKVYSLLHIIEIVNVFVLKTGIGDLAYHYANKYKKLTFRKRTVGGGKINKTW
jgi:hypothetical protein